MICNACENDIPLGDDLEVILNPSTFVCHECSLELEACEAWEDWDAPLTSIRNADIRAEKKVGIMYEYDHQRPLSWKEYQHWLWNPLPFGWAIISEPDEKEGLR